jgi:hypothetical protein
MRRGHLGDPRHVRTDEVEILVARELRKAGLALSQLRVLQRATRAPDDAAQYFMRFTGSGNAGRGETEVVIDFRNEAAPVSAELVRAFLAIPSDREEAAGPARLMPAREALEKVEGPPLLRVMFSTSGYDADAVREAHALGVVLLAVADGPAAFRQSQWSMGAQTPAWVPEYMAELVSLGPGGVPRRELILSARPALLDHA